MTGQSIQCKYPTNPGPGCQSLLPVGQDFIWEHGNGTSPAQVPSLSLTPQGQSLHCRPWKPTAHHVHHRITGLSACEVCEQKHATHRLRPQAKPPETSLASENLMSGSARTYKAEPPSRMSPSVCLHTGCSSSSNRDIAA